MTAEEWIKEKLQKQFLKDCHINPYDAPVILQQYADEVSREVAEDYEHFLYESKEIQTHPESQGKGWRAYQNWKSKQEQL